MLTCIPKSLCSWDFRVSGPSSGSASLTFHRCTEYGSIVNGGSELSIRKHDTIDNYWILERDGKPCAEARQPNALIRSFEVSSGATRFTLKAQSPHTRCYDIHADGQVVGTIRPAHGLTRRAFIECGSSVPELLQLFAFWLAALTWRRAADDNGAP
jgi:hypothetical protein